MKKNENFVPERQVHQIINTPGFKQLVARRWSLSLTLTLLMLVVYVGFILAVAFGKEVLATKIGEHVTIAVPIGIGIIVFAWLITGYYVRWANRVYDKQVEEFKNQL
jgi:uncharacterized membrane protein (DUF485 family)